MDAVTLARQLWDAERTLTASPPLRDMVPGLSISDAYAVQREVTRLRLEFGQRPVGRKIGLASTELLARAGEAEPFWAWCFEERRIANGATIDSSRYFFPRLEAEIALVLGADIDRDDLSDTELRAAVTTVHPSFEIVDIRTTVRVLDAAESIADSGWNAGFALGDAFDAREVELECIGVSVHSERNGPMGAGNATILLDGGPLSCLGWLAGRAIRDGHPLRAGEIILTGTMAGAQVLASGDTVTATYSGFGPSASVVSLSAS